MCVGRRERRMFGWQFGERGRWELGGVEKHSERRKGRWAGGGRTVQRTLAPSPVGRGQRHASPSPGLEQALLRAALGSGPGAV